LRPNAASAASKSGPGLEVEVLHRRRQPVLHRGRGLAIDRERVASARSRPGAVAAFVDAGTLSSRAKIVASSRVRLPPVSKFG
jgi:hypothetical protein